MDNDVAKKRAEIPEGASNVLDARDVFTSHKRLAELVVPGMSVLDVGCGTGAITRGIAELAGPDGRVVGVDQNPDFMDAAIERHRNVANLSFGVGDVYGLPFKEEFDLVTAARVLQWLSEPKKALQSLVSTVKPGGRVVILDYNHEKIEWTPEPPESVKSFYQAFLLWRADAGMNNQIADHLEVMFQQVGLEEMTVLSQHEYVTEVDPHFPKAIQIWADVMASRGKQMVRDGYLDESARALAEEEYRAWIQSSAKSQRMYLQSIEGVKPAVRV